MKRIPELRDLSDDHHHGLVLARKAKRAADGEVGPSVVEVWAMARESFRTELEPHFQIEEKFIGASLNDQGESQLAQRLLDEHTALREFFAPEHARTVAGLRRFGELLEQHIRFEERELFQVAQTTLDADTLAAVAAACRAKHRT